MARRMASLVPFYEFGEDQFFRSDDAPDDIAARRRNGFMRLAQLYRERFAETRRLTAEAREGISDLQFTDAYRVPFQVQPHGARASARRLVPGVVGGRNGH